MGLNMRFGVVIPINNVFTNIADEKTIFLDIMVVYNGTNGDGFVGTGGVYGKQLLDGGLIHDVNGDILLHYLCTTKKGTPWC